MLEVEDHNLKAEKEGNQGSMDPYVGYWFRPCNKESETCVAIGITSLWAVFVELNGLPPPRSHDHRIQLQDGAKPASLSPYKYPYYQKAKIEKLISEMLNSEIIKSS